MSRTERLFDLLDVLHGHHFPVSAQALADDLGISLPTLYRDIATLQARGVNIEGEPENGYILRPGFLLPPISFTSEEIEALVWGARKVVNSGDETLRRSAESALARISAIIEPEMQDTMAAPPFLMGSEPGIEGGAVDPVLLRKAIRTERKLELSYLDGKGVTTKRVIWPFVYAFFERVPLLIGWCELRHDFRSFRMDRILGATMLDDRYPKRKQQLLCEWRKQQGIGAGCKTD